MKRFFRGRRAVGIVALAGMLLLSGTLTSCDILLDPYADLTPEEIQALLGCVESSIESMVGEDIPIEDILPGMDMPDIDVEIDPDFSFDPTETEGFPCDEIVIVPPVEEVPLPDIVDIAAMNYYTSEEVTGLSFAGGYVDRHMYLYGVLDEGVLYNDTERLVPGVRVIDSYDEFSAMFDMSRRELMTNARNTENENECSFWNQLARMNDSYFDEWSLVVVLTPDAVDPFVNNEVRVTPIVGFNTSADITAIDIRTTEALYDKPAAAFAVMIPLYKGSGDVVAEDVVLGYNSALFVDPRLHERVGDHLSDLILNFDERITESPTWPVVKDPDVTVTDVLEKSRIENGVLHAFLPEDPEIFGSNRNVFWVNSPDDISRYLSFSTNDNIKDAVDWLEENPAYAMIQSYLDKDADFFEDQWLVLILLRESSWSISYDATVEDRGNETHIQINPVVGEELDNREAWWLLAVPVEAGDDYYVEIDNLDGSRDLASYRKGNTSASLISRMDE